MSTPSGVSARPRPRTWVLAGSVYLACAIVWHLPSSLSPADTVPTLGDSLHLAWVMAWDAHQVVRAPWALFESNSFHPYAGSLAFGDHLLPEAALAAPVFWTTGNAILASNVVVLVALVLSALSMFALAYGATGSSGAAFLAGLVYAFNGFTLAETPRVHVLNLQWWPLALLWLLRLGRGGRARDALVFWLMLALQGLSGTYYLVYSALAVPVWLAIVYARAGRRPSRRELAGLAGSALVIAAACGVLLWPYAGLRETFAFEKPLAPGADLIAFLDAGAGGVLWRPLFADALSSSEVPHFVGYVALLLAAAGAVVGMRARALRTTALIAVSTLAVGLVVCVGPFLVVQGRSLGLAPYAWLYDAIPLLRGMASTERAEALVRLGTALLVAMGSAAFLRRCGSSARLIAVALASVILCLEQWAPQPERGFVVPHGSHVPAVYAWLDEQQPGPVVELPLHPLPAKERWAAYLYFSTYHWQPIPFGRTSFYPPAHDFAAWALRDFPDERSLAVLQHLDLLTIVIHPSIWPESERRARLAAIEAEPRLRLVESFDDPPVPRFAALGLGNERVYRLEMPPASEVRACEPADEIPRTGWDVRGSGPREADAIRDADHATAWFTETPQRPGDRLVVHFGRSERLAALSLGLSYPFDEFPRHLRLRLRGEDGAWRRVVLSDGPRQNVETLRSLLDSPRAARRTLRLEPPAMGTQAILLKLSDVHVGHAWPAWSVPELRAYRTCE